jgi:UDP-N-acetylmuramate dehydrogenase
MITLPKTVKENYPLERLSTVRTGGSAEYFARANSISELEELLCWASENELTIGVVGSGSNLLIADEGVRGLVIKLYSDLTSIEQQDTEIYCGGGARLPTVSAFAARAGLSGIEFGVNIPGTVGGAVKMNANAYDGHLADVLLWVDVVTADGVERRKPEELDFTYRHSNIQPHQVVARACFSLQEAESKDVKATISAMRTKRRAAQPSGIKTFGSTFKNPDDPRAEGRTAGQLLEAAGCRGLTVGGVMFSDKHANFVENTGDGTTAEIVTLITEGRSRVREEFGIELETEVQVLGNVEWPASR